MSSELTREWRKWHNISVYETGRPPRFGGKCREAAAGRAAARAVLRRGAGAVGVGAAAGGGDVRRCGGVLPAAVAVPALRPDACAAACGSVVAAAVWRGGDHDGAAAGSRCGRGGACGGAAVAGGAGRGPVAGAGVDGVVVAGAVRRPGRRAAPGADGRAAAGGGRGGPGAGAGRVGGGRLPGGAGGGDGGAAPVPGPGRGGGA